MSNAPRRPTAVKVGPNTLNVHWLTHDEWYAKQLDNELCGEMNWGQSDVMIRLNTPVCQHSEYQLREILLHEIIHAVHEFGGLNAASTVQDDWSVMEEQITGLTSPVLLMVLRDNPKVLAYLTA